MTDRFRWDLPGVDASWCAGRIGGGPVVGQDADGPVTPASVIKVVVALTAGRAMEDGRVDGAQRVRLDPGRRTPGPVGMSLLSDLVEMSIRDLLVPMLTVSDNVATDALLDVVGLDAVNDTAAALGLTSTVMVDDLRTMLDTMAAEAGFRDYAAMAAHDPARHGPPSDDEVRERVAASSALDPRRGSRTTPADMVRLLSCVWTDAAASPAFCARLRHLMSQQLTRHRIASGFDASFAVAAKSGGLLGIVRHEVGVVTDRSGQAYAVAIFTRRSLDSQAEPAAIDSTIGALARHLVECLQPGS